MHNFLCTVQFIWCLFGQWAGILWFSFLDIVSAIIFHNIFDQLIYSDGAKHSEVKCPSICWCNMTVWRLYPQRYECAFVFVCRQQGTGVWRAFNLGLIVGRQYLGTTLHRGIIILEVFLDLLHWMGATVGWSMERLTWAGGSDTLGPLETLERESWLKGTTTQVMQHT